MRRDTIRPLALSLRARSTILPWILCYSILAANHVTAVHAYLLSSLLLVVSYGFVTIYNDIADRKIDISNQRKDIPFANNEISRNDLQTFLKSLLVLSLVVGIFLSQMTLLWLSLYLFLGWLYSGPLNFKSRGALAICILGVCYGAMPLLLGYAIVNQTPTLWGYLLIIASFIFAAGIISLKDFKDLKGDTLYDKKTLLVKYGPTITHRIILILTCLAYLLVTVGVWLSTNAMIYVCISIALLIINFTLLFTNRIRSESKVRKQNGNIARLTFFLYVATLNILLVMN